jgi:hypothetical protein
VEWSGVYRSGEEGMGMDWFFILTQWTGSVRSGGDRKGSDRRGAERLGLVLLSGECER